MTRDFVKKLLPILAVLAVVSACSTGSKDDPYEGFNRVVFAGNQRVDTYFLRPVAKGYRYITPDAVRTRIGNVSDNLSEPVNMLNAFLQGNFSQGSRNFFRFLINSSVGLAGLHDVATEAGIPAHTEDFGQTLAVWGVDAGPYLVLPIFGPSNLRDAGGLVVDNLSSPLVYTTGLSINLGVGAGQTLVLRERLIDPIDDINATSLDPYASFKSVYEQRRAADIARQRTDAKIQ